MRRDDAPALVALHREVFGGYNSTALGGAYLAALYGTLASSPATLSVVATGPGGELLGWLGGVTDYPAFNRTLALRCLPRSPAILFSLITRRPRLMLTAAAVGARVLYEATLGKRRRGPPSAPPPAPGAHLLVIGVRRQLQRRGVGQILMADFHRRLRLAGFATCSLSTFADNDAGNRAFRKAGYRLTTTADGVNRYAVDLRDEGPGGRGPSPSAWC